MFFTSKRTVRWLAFAGVGLVALGALAIAIGAAGDSGSSADVTQRSSPGGRNSSLLDLLGGEDGVASEESSEGAPAPSIVAPSADSAAGGLAAGEPSVGGALYSIDRKVIQTASMSIEVENVGQSFEEVSRVAASLGGFVSSSSFSLQGGNEIASLTIRVPAESSQEALSRLRGIGVKVVNQSSEASDVTEQYSDLSATLRNFEATESQLLLLLGRAEEIGEVLQVQDRLNTVRGSIEQIKGRMQLLDGLSEMATITVHLSPVLPLVGGSEGGTDLGAEVSEAWDSSIEFLTDAAAGVLRVVVFAWWVPIAVAPPILVAGRLRARPQALDTAD